MNQSIVFDMDGVIFDSQIIYDNNFKTAGKDFGLSPAVLETGHKAAARFSRLPAGKRLPVKSEIRFGGSVRSSFLPVCRGGNAEIFVKHFGVIAGAVEPHGIGNFSNCHIGNT